MRDAEQEMNDAGVKASGMKPQRYALQKERLQMWAMLSEESRAASFPDDERTILEKHHAQIEKVKGSL